MQVPQEFSLSFDISDYTTDEYVLQNNAVPYDFNSNTSFTLYPNQTTASYIDITPTKTVSADVLEQIKGDFSAVFEIGDYLDDPSDFVNNNIMADFEQTSTGFRFRIKGGDGVNLPFIEGQFAGSCKVFYKDNLLFTISYLVITTTNE